MDGSSCQVDGSRGLTDVLGHSSNAKMADISHGHGSSTYLGPEDAKHIVYETDGAGIQTDTLIRHGDVPSTEMDMLSTENEAETISKPQMKKKPPDIPIGAAKQHPNEPDGCRNHVDALSMYMDMHSIGNDMETAANETVNVRKRQNKPKSKNLPETLEIETSESIKWVSVGDINVYVPLNAPIEALGPTSQTFAFREVESGDKVIAPSLEGKRAGNSDGRQREGDGMVSSGNVDSM